MTKSRGIRPPRWAWSDDEIAWLVALYPDNQTALVAEALGRRVAQVNSMANALRIRKSAAFLSSPEAGRILPGDNRGAAGRFQSGIVPWNKGLSYAAGGRSPETRFAKGNRPHTWAPVGTVVEDPGGYLKRKVRDGGTAGMSRANWEFVHVALWREHHGPIPRGHAVVFKNGNKRDLRIENLELVTRRELMRRNSYHTNFPPEVRRVIQLRGALIRKINHRSRQHEQDH